MSSPENQKQFERAKRKALLKKTPLIDEAGNVHAVRVRNLSEKGLGGVCDMSLQTGEKITVELDGLGSLSGTIAWVDGKSFGMAFDTEIDLANLTINQGKEATTPTKYTVPDRFQPVKDFKRPGFH